MTFQVRTCGRFVFDPPLGQGDPPVGQGDPPVGMFDPPVGLISGTIIYRCISSPYVSLPVFSWVTLRWDRVTLPWDFLAKCDPPVGITLN